MVAHILIFRFLERRSEYNKFCGLVLDGRPGDTYSLYFRKTGFPTKIFYVVVISPIRVSFPSRFNITD